MSINDITRGIVGIREDTHIPAWYHRFITTASTLAFLTAMTLWYLT